MSKPAMQSRQPISIEGEVVPTPPPVRSDPQRLDYSALALAVEKEARPTAARFIERRDF